MTRKKRRRADTNVKKRRSSGTEEGGAEPSPPFSQQTRRIQSSDGKTAHLVTKGLRTSNMDQSFKLYARILSASRLRYLPVSALTNDEHAITNAAERTRCERF